MSGTSSKTFVVGVRLPQQTVIKARANVVAQNKKLKKGDRVITLSMYLGRLLERQINRPR